MKPAQSELFQMNLETYLPLALRTESQIPPNPENPDALLQRRLLHAAIGVSTEISELFSNKGESPVSFIEEAGDLAWYLAIATDALRLPAPRFVHDNGRKNGVRHRETLAELVIESGELLDLMKKWLFYDRRPEAQNVAATIFNLWTLLARLVASAGKDMEEVLYLNIEKLKVRYPIAFTKDYAINRDIASEQAALAMAL